MSLALTGALTHIRIAESEKESIAGPRPTKVGFRADAVYDVLGMADFSETSEAYVILANDDGAIYFISNRHVRRHVVEIR